jgi:WS/DGAT/MGAT family acyltransferase
MADAGWQRLGAQDASFLLFEHRATPMHVAAVALFEAAPLRTADGGVDAARLAKHVEGRLHDLPRYRQRLATHPLTGEPLWVDDGGFDLAYHLRHVALPRPGSVTALQELTGRLLSQPLDRSRPLWEMWIVEGVEGDRFALISKVHHCMVDGVAGSNLLTLLFSSRPDEGIRPAPAWQPRSPPGALRLVVGELAQRAQGGAEWLRWLGGVAARPRPALEAAAQTGAAVAQALDAALRLPAATSLNRPIGPHRRVEWRALELDAVKQVKNALGGTVNDVVLAIVAGALHRFLGARAEWPVRVDQRVVIPVNMRPAGDATPTANHVSALFLSLPVAEPDPLRRHERIRRETERLKGSRAAQGIEALARLADELAAPWLTRLGVRLATGLRPYNLIVTNVPGPRLPLYVLGARLVELYPHLPLFAHQGLGVAVLSYDGRLGFGLIADREVVPDLARLADAIPAAFAELTDAVAVGTLVAESAGTATPALPATSVPNATSVPRETKQTRRARRRARRRS